MLNVIYEQTGFLVFENRMDDSAAHTTECPIGDIRLVEDKQTGLAYNAAFDPELICYNGNYKNEQDLEFRCNRQIELYLYYRQAPQFLS